MTSWPLPPPPPFSLRPPAGVRPAACAAFRLIGFQCAVQDITSSVDGFLPLTGWFSLRTQTTTPVRVSSGEKEAAGRARRRARCQNCRCQLAKRREKAERGTTVPARQAWFSLPFRCHAVVCPSLCVCFLPDDCGSTSPTANMKAVRVVSCKLKCKNPEWPDDVFLAAIDLQKQVLKCRHLTSSHRP